MKCATYMIILCLFIVVSTASESDIKPKTLTSMAVPSITNGNTKITLIHLARTTSWTNQFVDAHEDQQGPMYAIPGVYLEFLVERLDHIPAKSKKNISTINLFQNGRLLSESIPVIAGGEGGIEQYSLRNQQFGFKRPVVKDESKAYILWSFKRGISIESGNVTIRFQAGFDQDNHIFEFRDIPLY
jgi:hypothetical protein